MVLNSGFRYKAASKGEYGMNWFENLQLKALQWLKENCPPGYGYAEEWRAFWVWLAVCVFYSLGFFWRYIEAHDALYYWNANERYLIPDIKMVPFYELAESIPRWFLGSGILLAVTVIIMHYHYYRRDSKSIYLMCRIKDRSFLRKTYVKVPITYLAVLAVVCGLLLLLYYGFYLLITPKVCL